MNREKENTTQIKESILCSRPCARQTGRGQQKMLCVLHRFQKKCRLLNHTALHLFCPLPPSLVCCDRQNIESHISYTRHLSSQRNCFLYALIHHFQSRLGKSRMSIFERSPFLRKKEASKLLSSHTPPCFVSTFFSPSFHRCGCCDRQTMVSHTPFVN